jgi:hypothetical protein
MQKRGATWFVLFTKYSLGDQMKEDEINGTCGTSVRKKRKTQEFGRKI